MVCSEFSGFAWDEMPAQLSKEAEEVRASRSSKAGIVKLAFNFMVEQKLFVEVNKRFYPTDRMKAIVEHYFEDYRGEIYAALDGGNHA